jgi:hypothetical protein
VGADGVLTVQCSYYLLHGRVHNNAFAALGTVKRFDCRESREGIQSTAIGAADATDHSRCHLHHDRGGEFHGHSPDDGAAFVAGYVSLIAAHLDNMTAAAIRSCSHLVRDDRKALFIAGHRSDYLAVRALAIALTGRAAHLAGRVSLGLGILPGHGDLAGRQVPAPVAVIALSCPRNINCFGLWFFSASRRRNRLLCDNRGLKAL